MSYSKTTDFPIADAARFFREIKNSLHFEEEFGTTRKAFTKPSSSRKKSSKVVSEEAY